MLSHYPALRFPCLCDLLESHHNRILNERVKPAMLNPLVRRVTASADIKWVLLCVGIAVAVFLTAMGVNLKFK